MSANGGSAPSQASQASTGPAGSATPRGTVPSAAPRSPGGRRPAPEARPPGRGPGHGTREHQEVEGPEGGVAPPEEPEGEQVDQVDAGDVHIEEVAVRDRALEESRRDVVHERRVGAEGPAGRGG